MATTVSFSRWLAFAGHLVAVYVYRRTLKTLLEIVLNGAADAEPPFTGDRDLVHKIPPSPAKRGNASHNIGYHFDAVNRGRQSRAGNRARQIHDDDPGVAVLRKANAVDDR
jgi:hypothetical protein